MKISASDVYANRRRAVQQLQGTAQSTEPATSSEAPWTQASAQAIYAGRRQVRTPLENPGSS